LKRLGKVLHTSSSGKVIVQLENLPKIGFSVIDEDLEEIGRVVDIFGPIDSPYSALKVTWKKPKEIKNKVVYLRSK